MKARKVWILVSTIIGTARAFAMSLGGGIASWRAEIYSDESIHNYERSVAMLKRAVDSGHYQ